MTVSFSSRSPDEKQRKASHGVDSIMEVILHHQRESSTVVKTCDIQVQSVMLYFGEVHTPSTTLLTNLPHGTHTIPPTPIPSIKSLGCRRAREQNLLLFPHYTERVVYSARNIKAEGEDARFRLCVWRVQGSDWEVGPCWCPKGEARS